MSPQFAEQPFDAPPAAPSPWLGTLRRLEDVLETRSALPSFVRERPLASVAVAFGAGFMLAAGGARPRGWIARTAYRRLGRMVVAGVGAVAIAEVRTLLGSSDRSEAEETDG